MTFCIAALAMMLFVFEVLKPVLHYNAWRAREAYDEESRLYKLKVVKEFYPVLLGRTLDEIDEQYGLDRVYNSVGRAYLKSRARD